MSIDAGPARGLISALVLALAGLALVLAVPSASAATSITPASGGVVGDDATVRTTVPTGPTSLAPSAAEPTRPTKQDRRPATNEPRDRSLGVTSVVLLLGAAVIVAATAGWAMGRRSGRGRSQAGLGAARQAPIAPTRVTLHSSADRDAVVEELIDGLIASYDLSTNSGQRARIVAALRRADVSVLEPTSGDLFDPSEHLALGTEGAPESDRVGRIARTERPGWRRGQQLLRHPEVVVWQ